MSKMYMQHPSWVHVSVTVCCALHQGVWCVRKSLILDSPPPTRLGYSGRPLASERSYRIAWENAQVFIPSLPIQSSNSRAQILHGSYLIKLPFRGGRRFCVF